MFVGDETHGWDDAGPCPDCGARDCWLGCIDNDRTGRDDGEVER